MNEKPTLEELELEEKKLKLKLRDVYIEIRKKLAVFPQVYIRSWDGMGIYEEGFYAIDAPLNKVEGIRKIVSSDKNTVFLKIREEILLEDYFTEDEIQSMRLL